jgi:hypothetical protein
MRPRPGRHGRDALILLLTAACASTPAPPAATTPDPVVADAAAPSPEPVPKASHDPAVAGTAPVPKATPDPVVADTAPVPKAIPTPADPPVPDLLGRPRRAVEARLGPARGAADGWVLYERVDLQYKKDRSVRARLTAPDSLDCADVPAWAGILNPVGHPLRRATSCEWPGISDRHRLTEGLAASHDLTTHRLEVWLRD